MLWLLLDISVFGSSYIFFLLCAARQLEQKDLRLSGEEKLHLRLKATLHGEVDSRLMAMLVNQKTRLILVEVSITDQ